MFAEVTCVLTTAFSGTSIHNDSNYIEIAIPSIAHTSEEANPPHAGRAAGDFEMSVVDVRLGIR